MNLLVKLLRPSAGLPTRQHPRDSGLDLYADEDCAILAGERLRVSTGIAVQPMPFMAFGSIEEQHYECQVRPRSGMSARGVDVAFGTVDATYTGEVMVTLINNSGAEVNILKGDRIAQLVVVPLPEVNVVEVTALTPTDRGDGGFGSTGR